MTRKIFLALIFSLTGALLFIALSDNPQGKPTEKPKMYIWGYVTCDVPGSLTPEDVITIRQEKKQAPLHQVPILRFGSTYLYRGLFPPGMQEGDYWVRGEGPKANSGFYHVYFDPQLDIRLDIYMSPHEPDK